MSSAGGSNPIELRDGQIAPDPELTERQYADHDVAEPRRVPPALRGVFSLVVDHNLTSCLPRATLSLFWNRRGHGRGIWSTSGAPGAACALGRACGRRDARGAREA
jgi:hypothetical protein